jgi:glycosyltransferase involved in cell wall biosynthesis
MRRQGSTKMGQNNLTDRALARADLYAHNFAKYLARRRCFLPQSPLETWAHYKLGKYQTVCKNTVEPKHWRSAYALAVSAAACGDSVSCRMAINALIAIRGHGKKTRSLARRLAAFSPQIALELTGDRRDELVFKIALLAKCGDLDKARELLEKTSTSPTTSSDSRELNLLKMNLINREPQTQLASLNQYLSSFGMAELATRSRSEQIGPQNISCDLKGKTVEGPRVSVIITTFNDQNRIATAIESLRQQSYTNIEMIIVDDASTDNTQSQVEEIQKIDSRLKYIRMPTNVGPYVSKSAGFLVAQGEFITCHDSDDWSHPSKIEQQVKPLLENSYLVATASKWVRLSDDGIAYARSTFPFLRLNPSSLMMRKRVMESWIGLWDCVRTGADSEIIARVRAIFGSSSIAMINKPLSIGSHRSNSLMTSKKTGMDTGSIRKERLNYWEAWSSWHISEAIHGRRPYIRLLNIHREYEAPIELQVAKSDIESCKFAAISYLDRLNAEK